MNEFDPSLDLRIERVIRATRARLWKAWTDPTDLARWWLPAPLVCRVERLEVVGGGGFVTSMSDNGAPFVDHLDACFVRVDPLERITFTNALDSRWRPAAPEPVAMCAEITFADHPDGTEYRAVVRHATPSARTLHETLGFAEGWGAVTAQLAALTETGETTPKPDLDAVRDPRRARGAGLPHH